MPSMLELTDVRAGYGSAEVLHGISLTVDQGEVAVILGANGVGKTTMLRSIAGLLRPWSGRISFGGKVVDRMGAEKIVRLGLGMVPGPPGIFRDMTVTDNLRVGSFALAKGKKADAQLERRQAPGEVVHGAGVAVLRPLIGGAQVPVGVELDDRQLRVLLVQALDLLGNGFVKRMILS